MVIRPTPREPGEVSRTTADHDRPDGQEHHLCVLAEDRSAFPYTDADTPGSSSPRPSTPWWPSGTPPGSATPGPWCRCSSASPAKPTTRLHDAVADARDQGYTWEQIADRLATSVSTARRRYRAYTTWRKEGCPWPMTRPATEN